MTIWFQMLNICREKGINPEWIIYPKQFQSHQQTATRASVIRELGTKFKAKEIRVLCPLTARAIWKILDKRGVKTNHLNGQN
jgi:adenine/guanine phosphoribosyltransferase-like PRPP-binding protein